ncbi:MAG: MATE family efflux transporter [Clostridium sp.]|jgi:Na+-driven multidrug efflux pump|nr:MATE family efflux transporter [Clostridium sp.]
MKKVDLVSAHPGASLFQFVWPMILGNLFQQFYNMADSMIVGWFLGEEPLAAVGASYSLTTVFIMLALGGGIGASVLTSQYYGAKLIEKMRTSISTALLSFFTVSIFLAGVGLLLNKVILLALKTPENILGDAGIYLGIYFIGLPFLFMYNILSAIFNALGKSKIPLMLLIFSSLLNISLDLLFVAGFSMGVGGAAAATVIAQGISVCGSFLILRRTLKSLVCENQTKYQTQEHLEFDRQASRRRDQENNVQEIHNQEIHDQEIHANHKPPLFDPHMLLRATKIAIPSMIQQSIVSVGMLLVQSVINSFGSSMLAGYSAGGRVESFCIVPMIAMGNAMSTFCAQNLGAGKLERVKSGYRYAILYVLGFAVIIVLFLQVFGASILSIFLPDAEQRVAFDTGLRYVHFLSFFYILIGLKSATDGILRGAGDILFMVTNLINLTIRVTLANALAPSWGVDAVWWAVPIGWGVNFVLSFLWMSTGHWRKRNLINE